MADSGPIQSKFQIKVPPQHHEGHYADFASIWHNKDAFVIDFIAMTRPPMPAKDEQGSDLVVVEAEVVTRVRIPASQVFEVMKGLEQQLSAWEKETGQTPGTPPPDPSDPN